MCENFPIANDSKSQMLTNSLTNILLTGLSVALTLDFYIYYSSRALAVSIRQSSY